MGDAKSYLVVLISVLCLGITSKTYSQSKKVYDTFYEKFNPRMMKYNPNFEFSLHKENSKLLWIDDEYSLEDEYGNPFKSKFLVDLAYLDKNKIISILYLEFKQRQAAKKYYEDAEKRVKNDSQIDVRLVGDGYNVAMITQYSF